MLVISSSLKDQTSSPVMEVPYYLTSRSMIINCAGETYYERVIVLHAHSRVLCAACVAQLRYFFRVYARNGF